MFSFITDMKISARIALLAAVPISGLLILTAAYFIGEHNVRGEFGKAQAHTRLAELSDGVQTSALQLRRHEKDFLLRKDKQYVEKHRAETLAILKLIDKMEASAVAGELTGQTTRLRDLITAYAGQFDTVVGLHQTLGYDHQTGLQGALRKAVHDVEEKLQTFNVETLVANSTYNADKLTVKMLMMRRHEKDFILRGDEKYLGRHAKRREEFDLLLLLSGLPEAEKAEITRLMDAYRKNFVTWAKADIKVRAEIEKLSAHYTDLEPSFEVIDKSARLGNVAAGAALVAVQQRTQLIWIITAGLLLALVLSFTCLVARGISRPLARITAATQQLAEGDLDVEVIDDTRSDEIGNLASALQVFKQNGVEKHRLELEKLDAQAEAEKARAEDLVRETLFQSQIDETVQAAAKGDFTRRLDADSADGAMQQLGEGMNRLLTVVERGLSETIGVVSALAQGDLSKKIEGDYDGSFLTLKNDVNRMSDQMRTIANRIALTSNSVSDATGEIASGVTDLSSRTEHQASSLEETTASMEELAATVKQNADNAQEANQVAVAARESATNGGQVVDDAVSAMSRIEGSSKQITEIVGLIQEIAFQTNLLALNAAVEAARAGDAGRGFAVVANEVRALAQRAGQASKDIQDLITNSDNQVREGVELVNKAGASLEDIVGSVKKVADFVSEIAAASQEQSAGIDQVSRAINSMEEMTQQNGALVEETTAALQSAQTQVGDLRKVVAFFKTDGAAAMLPVAETGDDEPAAHPVHQQQAQVRRAAAAGRVAADAAGEDDDGDDWQEF
ncbi:MAG: HAMP domain-containing protein [Rhizobiales bacterium]|nr:HAMP domain-containing protein [Hyphomicrobiales bacterium]